MNTGTIKCSKCGKDKLRSEFSQRQLKTKKICKDCVEKELQEKTSQVTQAPNPLVQPLKPAQAPQSAKPLVQAPQPTKPLVRPPQPSKPLVQAPQPSKPLVQAPKATQPSKPLAQPPQATQPPKPAQQVKTWASLAKQSKSPAQASVQAPQTSVPVPGSVSSSSKPKVTLPPPIRSVPATPASTVAPSTHSEVSVPSETQEDIPSITVGEDNEMLAEDKKYAYPKKKYGRKGRPTEVLANHFRVTLPKEIIIYQYDIKYCRFKNGKAVNVTLPKDVARSVVELVRASKEFKTQIGDLHFVTDRRNILYSVKKFDSFECQVQYDDGSEKDHTVGVTITLTPHVYVINSETLKNRDHVHSLPPLDMYHVYNQTLKKTYFGRSVFDPTQKGIAIGGGACILWGYTQSFRLSDDGFYNVMEPTASIFYISQPLLQFVTDFLGEHILDHASDPKRCCLGEANIAMLAKELRGVKVVTKHLGHPQTYGITGIAKVASSQDFFDWEENGKKQKISVYQYFQKKYRINLRYPGLPCILKNNAKVPIELCYIKGGQRRMSKLDGKQQQIVVRSTAIRPDERKKLLTNYSNTRDFTGDDYLSSIGVKVSNNMTKVQARILDSPNMFMKKGAKPLSVPAKFGQYDNRNLMPYEGTSLDKFAVVILQKRYPIKTDDVLDFYNSMKLYGVRVNESNLHEVMKLCRPILVDRCDSVRNEIIKVCEMYKKKFGSLQLILVWLPMKDASLYRIVKTVTDSVLGVPSQCVVYDPKKNGSPQFRANVCLKLNAKLGGFNAYFEGDDKLIPCKKTMILGADVTHPMRGEAEVSIAAVVATIDPHYTKYVGEARCQDARKEIIKDLEEIMVFLLLQYKNVNKCLPDYLLFYRDGVGDEQIDIVINTEIPKIFSACERLQHGYKPKLTFLIVQKRHSTRFFPINKSDLSKSGNLNPGIVVDRGITDKFLYDFFLHSHNVLQGTGRCGYYVVLYDSFNIDADLLQEITYKLCYTFCRCTKAISVCAPARYAHHLAFRHRDILGVADGNQEGKSYNTLKLNENMNTRMYFI